MRLNVYIAQATGLSRRAADQAITDGRVTVNDKAPDLGQQIHDGDRVALDNQLITLSAKPQTILLNKPVGFVCSRDGQGNQTIYDLLPESLHHLKPVGRLDKNSSGLLLLTSDGQLSYQLTHPKFEKTKVYKIAVNKPLEPDHRHMIDGPGVMLEDGISHLELESVNATDRMNWKVTMSEGRNRQIRRTFEALGYNVVKLHRTRFGDYQLNALAIGKWIDT